MTPEALEPSGREEDRAARPRGSTMRLKVLLPSEVLIDEEVHKVIAEAENGQFCLLPGHIDFVTALTPGILYYSPTPEQERYAAVNNGVLVKCGGEVLVSTLSGMAGDNLEELKTVVQETFLHLDEHEREARTALARLEAATLRGFRESEAWKHG